MKTAVYATLLGIVNAKHFDIVKEFVQNQLSDLEQSLEEANWIAAKLNVLLAIWSKTNESHLVTSFVSSGSWLVPM
jgi:hypothetical protein